MLANQLKFVGQYGSYSPLSNSLRFIAAIGLEVLFVGVSLDAITVLGGFSEPVEANAALRFAREKKQVLEAIAGRKYAAGLRERDGGLLITAEDVAGLPGSPCGPG